MRTTVPNFRTLVLISIFLISGFHSFSQSITTGNGKYEIGLGIGPMFFLGDLGGNAGKGTAFIKDVNLPLTKIAKGIYAEVYPTEWLSFRLSINQGMLEGYDSIIKSKGGDEDLRKQRNLNFRSNIIEAYAAAEIYPTVFLEQYEGLQGKLRPYGLIGLGFFHYNPQGIYYAPNGHSAWVDLHPLRLEGQGMAEYPDRPMYKLTAFEIPVGIGVKYYLKENFYLGFEVLHRKTSTDYIDDVSTTYIDASLFDKYLTPAQAQMAHQLYNRQNFGNNQLTRPVLDEQRGSPKNRDSYFSSVIRFGWRLNDNNSPSGRASRQLRCPSFY